MNPIQSALTNLAATRDATPPPSARPFELVGYEAGQPLIRQAGGQPFRGGQIDTNGAIAAGLVPTRQAGEVLRIDGVPRVIESKVPSGLEEFLLYVCIDQTGSIGIEGIVATLKVIEKFSSSLAGNNRLRGIGFLSFGDRLCQVTKILAPKTAEAMLIKARDERPTEFFCDAGGDTPENGIDALAKAIEQIKTSPVKRKYIYMKTDTWGFNHNEINPAAVLKTLNNGLIEKTFLDFGTQGIDEGTSYALTFPEGRRISHQPFKL